MENSADKELQRSYLKNNLATGIEQGTEARFTIRSETDKELLMKYLADTTGFVPFPEELCGSPGSN
jgi:hypothetical protein